MARGKAALYAGRPVAKFYQDTVNKQVKRDDLQDIIGERRPGDVKLYNRTRNMNPTNLPRKHKGEKDTLPLIQQGPLKYWKGGKA